MNQLSYPKVKPQCDKPLDENHDSRRDSVQGSAPRGRSRWERFKNWVNPLPCSLERRPDWKRRLRYFYYRFLRIKGSPQYLARGLAIGVFAGFFPLFGLQTLIGIGLAIPCRGHKLMAAAGTWVSNPLTYGPIFWLNFEVGQWVLGSGEVFASEFLESASALLLLGTEFVTTLLVGCAIVGTIAASASYFIGLWAIGQFRQARRRDRHRKLY